MAGLILRWLLALSLAAGAAGCSNPEPPPTVIAFDGTIQAIRSFSDDNGEITLRYRDKRGNEASSEGVVTPETDILIRGVAGSLRDLREGERIHGFARLDKIDGERKLAAMRIYVDPPREVRNAPPSW